MRYLLYLLIAMAITTTVVSADPISEFVDHVTGKYVPIEIPISNITVTGCNVTEASIIPANQDISLEYTNDIPKSEGICISLSCPDSLGYYHSYWSGSANNASGIWNFNLKDTLVSNITGCEVKIENVSRSVFT